MDLDFAADENLRELSDEETWEAIENFAQCQKEWDNPPNIISKQEVANLKAQVKRLIGNENVWVEMHRGIAWDKVENPDPQSAPQVLLSFEEYTPPPQPQPFPSFSSLEVDQGEEKALEPPIEPHSPDSFRMKEVDNLTIHTPPSPHVESFHPKDTYCYYHPCIDDPKKHYGFKPGLLGQSGSLGVDLLKLETIYDDWELGFKEVSFLGRELSLPVRPKEVEKNNAVGKASMSIEEYEMWVIRTNSTFSFQDLCIWEVIENRNSWVPIPVTTPESGPSTTLKMTVPSTVEEKICKKNDVKARSLLLMALPNETALTFQSVLLMLNQCLLPLKLALEGMMQQRSTGRPYESNSYENLMLKIQEITGFFSLSGFKAFLVDATVYAFLSTQPQGSQLVHEDLEQLHDDDLEEMDLKKIIIDGSNTAGYDKSKVYVSTAYMGQICQRNVEHLRSKDNRNWNQGSSSKAVKIEDAFEKAMYAIDGAEFD
ncbi:hypothetical protein Tco_0348860 [Tanacetum coccineum]